jgi:hypothetical protein
MTTTATEIVWFDGRWVCEAPPAQAVADCSARGANDDAVDHWVTRLGFDGPPELIRQHLRDYGAWSNRDLTDHHQNLRRLFWIWCHDIREGMDPFDLHL